jgi:hypothetical protein
MYANFTQEELNNEVWRDVIGYEGLYQVSNLGRVKSLDRMVSWRGVERPLKGKILEPNMIYGYCNVRLYSNGMAKNKKVHRLVAQAFIPNQENKPTVNHKFGVTNDNRVEMLEWATRKEQVDHSYRVLNRKGVRGGDHYLSKKCYQYSLDGKLVNEYPSVADAMRENNMNHCIYDCLLQHQKTAYGFIWKYN